MKDLAAITATALGVDGEAAPERMESERANNGSDGSCAMRPVCPFDEPGQGELPPEGAGGASSSVSWGPTSRRLSNEWVSCAALIALTAAGRRHDGYPGGPARVLG